MRMRSLGEGQSVVFMVPSEIENKILAVNKGSNQTVLGVSDVICWAIHETWLKIERLVRTSALQGHRFVKQKQIWNSVASLGPKEAEQFLEAEARSLEDRFRPNMEPECIGISEDTGNEQLDKINSHARSFKLTSLVEDSLNQRQEQEQQQELAPEIQEERSVERPGEASYAPHRVSPEVRAFVQLGTIPEDSAEFIWAYNAFRETTLWPYIMAARPVAAPALLVTKDFITTIVKSRAQDCLDSYQRGVQWVLTSREQPAKYVVVISPFEADRLMDNIKLSEKVALHIYAPRQNKQFSAIDDLELYTIPAMNIRTIIPREITIELNLFAGQLFFKNFKEYTEVCDYLGLAWSRIEEGPGMEIQADGFINITDPSVCTRPRSRFSDSPVMLFRVLMSKIRRDCGGIEKTHIGKLLDGIHLTEDDFDGREKRGAEQISAE